LSADFYSAPVPCTYYYGFTNTKPPFDDVRVRTAFAQSIDRQSLIDNVLKGGQIPATSFAPPGMFGAPAPGTVGLPYDPDAAMASLQAYMDEMGYTIDDFNALGSTLMHNTSEGHANIAAAVQQMWSDNLGVEVTVENQEWAVYLKTVGNDTPLEDVPHVWRMGWCADYPDENNWIHEVFNSDEGANRVRTDNAEFNALTVAAGAADTPEERAALYLQAEEMFAVEMVAYAPIYHYTTVNVTHQWLTRNFAPLGATDFFNWTLDADARD
jgi:oligopeptide transport system substrate-binding protein